MQPPPGIAELEGVLASGRMSATITLPVQWLRDLMAYLHAVETEAQMQRADEPVSD
jgi:hypothetical protein